VGEYREEREQKLRDMAITNASKAKKFGRNMSMPPMTPFDRRTVHTTVQEIEGENSFSVGEGSDRRVVIAPDEQYRKPDNRRGGGGYNRDSRGGGNLQRNQRNAQNNRRFPGDDRGGRSDFRRDDRRPPPRNSSPAQQQPSRPPRSDTASAGRYGKIEPRRADQETKKDET